MLIRFEIEEEGGMPSSLQSCKTKRGGQVFCCFGMGVQCKPWVNFERLKFEYSGGDLRTDVQQVQPQSWPVRFLPDTLTYKTPRSSCASPRGGTFPFVAYLYSTWWLTTQPYQEAWSTITWVSFTPRARGWCGSLSPNPCAYPYPVYPTSGCCGFRSHLVQQEKSWLDRIDSQLGSAITSYVTWPLQFL